MRSGEVADHQVIAGPGPDLEPGDIAQEVAELGAAVGAGVEIGIGLDDELPDLPQRIPVLVAADRAPTVLDVPCERYAPGASPRYAYLSYSYGCGRFPEPGLRLASPYPWRDWLTLTPHVDTLAVDLDGAPIRALLQAP